MKDQKKLLQTLMKKELPHIIFSGNDKLALPTMQFYLNLAIENKCNSAFIEDLKLVVTHFKEHTEESPNTIKLPD